MVVVCLLRAFRMVPCEIVLCRVPRPYNRLS
jgi:hypothetical protein